MLPQRPQNAQVIKNDTSEPMVLWEDKLQMTMATKGKKNLNSLNIVMDQIKKPYLRENKETLVHAPQSFDCGENAVRLEKSPRDANSIHYIDVMPTLASRNFWEAFHEIADQFIQNAASRQVMKNVAATRGQGMPIPTSDLRDFNRAYFVRNFLKATFAAERSLQEIHSDDFLDIGAGLGVFSLAFDLVSKKPDKTYLLCDQSGNQLEESKTVTTSIKLHGKFSHEACKAEDKEFLVKNSNFRLASYFLHEVLYYSQDFEWDAFLRPGALIVDYPEVINKVQRESVDRGFDIVVEGARIHVPEDLMCYVEQEVINATFARVVARSDSRKVL